MNYWFQNLNENGKQLFHFRGSMGSDYRRNWFKYEVSSGFNIKLKYQHGESGDDDTSSMLILGLGFCAIYLTFYLPKSWYFKRKCIAPWDNNREFYLTDGREYGFYFYSWSFVWSFHKKINESSSKDPWWLHQYIHLDELLLGKWESLTDYLTENQDIWFSIGDKEFKMDSIKWERNRRFRRFIPYSLFHKTYYSVKMDIKDPPMYFGKGENSWDCGDDGSFGLSGPWSFEPPTWQNREESTKLAVKYYVDHIMKDAKRYGGSSSERGIRTGLAYEYIGRKQATP